MSTVINLDTIIFGVNDYAQLAHYYLTNDSKYKPVAFCVDDEFMPEVEKFCDLPVIPFSKIEQLPKSVFNFFSPMAINDHRRIIYGRIKKMGYNFINYISSKATVLTKDIGENNFILEDNTIQPFVKIGNNNILWSGNHIGHHSVIGDHNTFTSHVVLSGHCNVGNGNFFGVNSCIRDARTIGDDTVIGMGAVLTKNPEPGQTYIGNPAIKKV